jgi:hypothetical protein
VEKRLRLPLSRQSPRKQRTKPRQLFMRPVLVLQAIHQVLDAAKKHESKISVGRSDDRASLSSSYTYRLFQLLPVLRQLDGSEADVLAKESPEVQEDLRKFPDGIQIFTRERQDASHSESKASSFGMAGRAESLSSLMEQRDLEEEHSLRLDEISQIAREDCERAVNSADSISIPTQDPYLRLDALLTVAEVCKAKNQSSTRHALKLILDCSRTLTGRMLERNFPKRDIWSQAIEVASQIDDQTLAREFLELGLELAQKSGQGRLR